jgi:hypothetical protein
MWREVRQDDLADVSGTHQRAAPQEEDTARIQGNGQRHRAAAQHARHCCLPSL